MHNIFPQSMKLNIQCNWDDLNLLNLNKLWTHFAQFVLSPEKFDIRAGFKNTGFSLESLIIKIIIIFYPFS